MITISEYMEQREDNLAVMWDFQQCGILTSKGSDQPAHMRWLIRAFASRLNTAGRHSAVGNVSGYRCVSDCRSMGREFDPDPVTYFRGDWSWNNFYGYSPSLLIHSRKVVVSYKLKYVHELLVNRLFKPAQEKVWIGELTVLPWP